MQPSLKLQVSQETLLDCIIIATIFSFQLVCIELIKYIAIRSERISQDPLEKFSDVNAREVLPMRTLMFETVKNTQALRVINTGIRALMLK